MRIHMVYAGDPHSGPDCAPFTITRRVYTALSALAPVTYYDWCHCGPFDPVGPDDIVIGHPNYPDVTATRQLFKSRARAKILIFPLHHGMPEINLPFDDVARQADAILSITGQYWYDTLESSPFAHWKGKMTRLDMAIDMAAFPHVKQSFSPQGQRQFFYIGADRPEKGLSNLERIFAGTGHQLHLYGHIGDSPLTRMPNVHVHGWTETSPGFARDLATFADCYVHGGVSDANPTTLLESASWGFLAACTPQSGYWPGRPFYGLNMGDIDGCRTLLNYVQSASESDLAGNQLGMRAAVARDHTWDIFTSKVVEVVRRFM